MNYLDGRPSDQLVDFLARAREAGADGGKVENAIWKTRAWLKGGEELKGGLLDRWYAALDAGAPDYTVYGEDEYLADLWAGWVTYSRGYLRGVRSILGDFNPAVVVDVGCGFGYTTAALAQLYPLALRVSGTNLPGIQQRIAEGLGVRVLPSVDAPADLVFASEYFEHFAEPVEHLRSILDVAAPTYLVTANTFNSRSIGHFPSYRVDGETLSGPATSRAFGAEMRRRGYAKLKTGLWNERPTFWVKH
jgi:SAM-dependent methyltransferase